MDSLKSKPDSESTKRNVKSSHLPVCTGCFQHELARDEWWWYPGLSEAWRMKGAVSIWPQTVIISGNTAITRPLSLAHAFHVSTSQGTRTRASGVMEKLWFEGWSKEQVVRKEEDMTLVRIHSFSHCGFCGSNSGPKAWWQVYFTCWPILPAPYSHFTPYFEWKSS